MHGERRWYGASIDDCKERGESSWKVYLSVLFSNGERIILFVKKRRSDGTASTSLENRMTLDSLRSDHFSALRTLELRQNPRVSSLHFFGGRALSVQMPEYKRNAKPRSPTSLPTAPHSLSYFEHVLARIPDVDICKSIEKLSKH